MAQTNVYIHKRDGVSLGRMQRTAASQSWSMYTFQLRAGVSTTAALGITWDGRHLWVCTEGEAASATRPGLLQLDPYRSGAGLSPQKMIQCPGLPTNYDIRDIVWNGRGFYAIVIGSGGVYWLVELSVDGELLRTINTGLQSTSRGIAWGGGSTIYVTWYFFGSAVIAEYDLISGNLMRNYFMFLPNGPSSLGPGIVHNGTYLATKVVRTPIDFSLVDLAMSFPAGGVQAMYTDTSANPGAGTEQQTLAWDGAFYWTIASEDTAGGGD